jgi:hypothetical protein
MSTKIYDAYRYDGTVEKLQEWLYCFRKRYCAYALADLKKLLQPTLKFMEVLSLIQESTKSGLNIRTNIEASVIVYFYQGSIYIKFCGVPDRLLKRLGPEFKDFHFHTSSDRPKHISERDWRHRRCIWDGICKHGATFADNGWLFRLVPSGFEYKIAHAICKK